VATLAGSYAQVYAALTTCLERILGSADAATEQALFRDNAARFYGV
jgi:predicted TIM-barrel fold metal-dependent hydrolase